MTEGTLDTVDLVEVRACRRELADIAQKHPDLTSSESQERLAAWLLAREVDREDVMVTKGQVPMSIRLDSETAERLDRVAVAHSPPGLQLTRTSALRMALNLGLDALEAMERTDGKPRRPRGGTK